jgi:pimeloyl-ACP methyl ester carboxylesterase
LGVHQEFFTQPSGPRIAYVVLEPGDYGLSYRFRADAYHWGIDLKFGAQPGPPPPPHGTVVLLHGWSLDQASNVHWAVALAERGYRAVSMDLRNHGASGKAPAGLGSREADDVVALIEALERNGRLAEPLFVFGVSLGAVTALETATRSDKVRAVIALEPFANAAEAVRSAGVGLARIAPMHALTERLATPERLDQVVAELSQRLDLDLGTLRTEDVVKRIDACTVIVHGQRDSLIPIDSTRALGAGQANITRVELPWDGHFSTPARLDLLANPIAAWLEAVAARGNSSCPRFRFYPFAPTNGVPSELPPPA